MIASNTSPVAPLIIGMDFDNTLVYASRNALKIAAEEFGIKLDLSSPRDYHFKEYPEEMKDRIYQMFRTPEFSVDLKIIPGTVEKLNEWKSLGHKLVLITARDKIIRAVTNKYLEDNFPMIDEVHYVDMFSSKAEKFKELNINVWIDDSPVDVPIAINMGIKTYLISSNKTVYNFPLRENLGLRAHTYENISFINL